MLNFSELYEKEIKKSLTKEFGYTNPMEVPKLVKIVVNMGLGKEVVAFGTKAIEAAENDLSIITGQRPIRTHAKKSNASFKIREGMPIGCKVTLRKAMMYSMLERLVIAALPRTKDFSGFSIKNFDGNGNMSFGLNEHIVFPGIEYDKVERVLGLNITIVTTAKTNEEARALLKAFNIPIY